MADVRVRLPLGVLDSGRGKAWYSACFGRKQPRVRVPPGLLRDFRLAIFDCRFGFSSINRKSKMDTSSQSSQECSPPCQGGDREFKSHRGRLHRTVRKPAKRRSLNLRDCLWVRLPPVLLDKGRRALASQAGCNPVVTDGRNKSNSWQTFVGHLHTTATAGVEYILRIEERR